MSYTPTVWQTGDTITAEKLNKLENGVASGGGSGEPDFIIWWDEDLGTFKAKGKSFSELCAKLQSGAPLTAYNNDGYLMPMVSRYVDNGSYSYVEFVAFMIMNQEFQNETIRYRLYDIAMDTGPDSSLQVYTYTYSNGEYNFTFNEQGG